MDNLFIPILLGTARKERKSEKAAKFVFENAKIYNKFDTQLIDVRDFVSSSITESAMSEEKGKEWQNIMDKADGLIIVSPEYNHGYPGELKLMLDQLYDEYNKKALGICGVSSGKSGGIRMAEVLRLSAIELQMVPIRDAIYFPQIEEFFDNSERVANFEKQLNHFFEELTWYAAALKAVNNKGRINS